jgi:hypothetical protein
MAEFSWLDIYEFSYNCESGEREEREVMGNSIEELVKWVFGVGLSLADRIQYSVWRGQYGVKGALNVIEVSALRWSWGIEVVDELLLPILEAVEMV